MGETREQRALKCLYGAAIGNQVYTSTEWGEHATEDYRAVRRALAELDELRRAAPPEKGKEVEG